MDELLVKIARAMVEGCDGRSFASDDAKILHKLYHQAGADHPKWSFEQCGIFARVQFMKFVLESVLPSIPGTTAEEIVEGMR